MEQAKNLEDLNINQKENIARILATSLAISKLKT